MDKFLDQDGEKLKDPMIDALTIYNERKLNDVIKYVDEKSYMVKGKKVIDVDTLKEILNLVLLQFHL